MGLTPYGILVAAILPFAYGFSFNTTTPTQCSQFTVNWDGGSEPFQFLLVPINTVNAGRILNISIPTGLQQPYSYTFDLNEPSGLQFLATMYDSTGFGSGGTTPALTVGSSDNSSCLDNNLLYDFTFSIDPQSNPAQCSTQNIAWLANATDPVQLFGLIPSGTAFQIPLPSDTSVNSLDWQVNIAQNTQYLLVMSDNGQYQTGGSSPLITVASGSDTCINSTSPRSGGTGSGTGTAASPGATVSGVGGTSSGGDTSGQTGSGSGTKSKTGAIVGGTVGGVAFLLLLGLLLICCIRRRARSRRDSETDPVIKSYGVGGAPTEKRRTGQLDLLSGGRHPHRQTSDDSEAAGAGTGGAEYQPSPFRYPSPPPQNTAVPAPTHVGAAALGGAAIGAAASEKTRTGSPRTPTHPNPPFANDPVRPSYDSDRTASDLATTGQTPSTPTGAQPSSSWSEIGGTDMATAGHGAQRNSSISKPPHRPVSAVTASPGSGNRPLPGVPPPSGPGATFVQHEDSGEVVPEVVDLPPRYDQLRARNPDQ